MAVKKARGRVPRRDFSNSKGKPLLGPGERKEKEREREPLRMCKV